MTMVTANVCCALPPTTNDFDPKESKSVLKPAWPHLQGIYEFFLQLVINESVEVRSLKVYVTPQFVQDFLELFDSEESVERDYLKNILHKLYAKVS